MFKGRNNKDDKTSKNQTMITVIAEFAIFDSSLAAQNAIADLSEYISEIPIPAVKILTDIQKHPKGYRVTYTIVYHNKKHKDYTKYLANVKDWLFEDTPIFRYYYNENDITSSYLKI